MMIKTESVLISVSVIVTAPISDPLPDGEVVDSVLEGFCRPVAERLGAGVPALKSEPWFEEDSGVNFTYLSEENAGHCARCGRWTSDYDAPGFLDLLMIGKTIGGKLFCDECIPGFSRRRLYLVREEAGAGDSASASSNSNEETGRYADLTLRLAVLMQTMQQITQRTRNLANSGMATRDLDEIFDCTDSLYYVALQEMSLGGNFRGVLEDAAKRYPAVFGGLMTDENASSAERFGWQESRAHRDGYSGSVADEVIRQRGE